MNFSWVKNLDEFADKMNLISHNGIVFLGTAIIEANDLFPYTFMHSTFSHTSVAYMHDGKMLIGLNKRNGYEFIHYKVTDENDVVAGMFVGELGILIQIEDENLHEYLNIVKVDDIDDLISVIDTSTNRDVPPSIKLEDAEIITGDISVIKLPYTIMRITKGYISVERPMMERNGWVTAVQVKEYTDENLAYGILVYKDGTYLTVGHVDQFKRLMQM